MDERERRGLTAIINTSPQDREFLQDQYGADNVWNTVELSKYFDVIGFAAPFCVVRRKSDGKKGSVMFQHSPRYYFNFSED